MAPEPLESGLLERLVEMERLWPRSSGRWRPVALTMQS